MLASSGYAVAQSLIIMSKPAGHPDVGIPAVFVSQKAGIIMHRLITPGESVAVIIPVRRRLRCAHLGVNMREPALLCDASRQGVGPVVIIVIRRGTFSCQP